ncbi:plasmid partitioning protein RepB C-terminal domain-containing protein [Labrenzia sp. OB1]|uniref:ParB/RepB/Spo0J family partition protein n=1 Tax=Labrenzia sp. OB1 TaxID=1561204 RepID=UPI0007B2824D|nr:plasmid partitioning protein RepB C-terminal domain-containing protein [Labrenzia sp. OB1]KZM49575.1 plasmid stablization protein ParB [Labrenzia sp. OB1]
MDLQDKRIELIPLDQIAILNPRDRNQKVFREIVTSIAEVGLKRPITVTKNGSTYALVCGQGRLEALRELGQSEIPAFVIEADTQTSLIKSLVENCARRHHPALDLLHDIGGMKERGYSNSEIAKKTGLSQEYIKGVGKLLRHGEQRLLHSVEAGQIPVSVAVEIIDADDVGIQEALQQAYESNVLRGRKLSIAKRVIENRHRKGKGLARPRRGSQKVSSNALVKAYQEDTDRKKILIRTSEATRSRLLFITHALRELLQDEDFLAVLEIADLGTIPKRLIDRIETQELKP